jgi:hypothetical protein
VWLGCACRICCLGELDQREELHECDELYELKSLCQRDKLYKRREHDDKLDDGDDCNELMQR